ncbi:type II toxin-antitoxin system VapC family toxin [Mucilaginibacter sp. HMF5004]|uniref:type II toxin-antitoxin system VapC family toxin n=1 Tax=Mucilaginibacter rivuli TaxID=2857527 RepID=UPI001C5D0BD2|nr:type II toxin-antitoxin system VapC family toxin [Mucilaginibacter rivuli]MBW4891485.1 type II toxin-antitoxin system VapC family toxin [Mucilaginibacter rivuli]
MYLLDSNIIIYSYWPQYEYLRKIFIETVYASEISRIEVLGYHKLSFDEESYYKDFFKSVPIIYPTSDVFNKSIEIRKAHNLTLGDSLIAATALINDLTLYSRNVKDFRKINDLKLIDPINEN